ncbi:hypothetical protein BV20DRAFT_172070 [Pilatotrama ljubarskyi]|nr:hypothetical protein BV20DRAFT_172070 [Pilatotrama ljubarskyi]
MTTLSPVAGGSTLLRIDDTSPRLQYSGQWAQGGTGQDYLSTSHVSDSSGSSVTFTFNGTFVTVYGSVGSTGSSSSYALDDEPPVTSDIYEVPSPQHNWPFFFPSSTLEPGLHKLVITVAGGTFSLDYIEYTSIAGEENVGDVQAPSSSSLSSSLPSAVLSSPDSSPSSSMSPSQGLSGGAIAGIAVAAVVVVLAVVLALLYVRRRSARKVRHQSYMAEKGIDILFDAPPKQPETNTRLSPFVRRLSRIYRPTPAKSAQSSKTATSSAPTSITQSSAMFTSVIMVSPALSMVSEESTQHESWHALGA